MFADSCPGPISIAPLITPDGPMLKRTGTSLPDEIFYARTAGSMSCSGFQGYPSGEEEEQFNPVTTVAKTTTPNMVLPIVFVIFIISF